MLVVVGRCEQEFVVVVNGSSNVLLAFQQSSWVFFPLVAIV